MVIHADVNAAFNIAAASSLSDKAELHRMRISRRQIRKLARTSVKPAACPEEFCNREMLAGPEKGQKISAPGHNGLMVSREIQQETCRYVQIVPVAGPGPAGILPTDLCSG
jgi:hypothetical protein